MKHWMDNKVDKYTDVLHWSHSNDFEGVGWLGGYTYENKNIEPGHGKVSIPGTPHFLWLLTKSKSFCTTSFFRR